MRQRAFETLRMHFEMRVGKNVDTSNRKEGLRIALPYCNSFFVVLAFFGCMEMNRIRSLRVSWTQSMTLLQIWWNIDIQFPGEACVVSA